VDLKKDLQKKVRVQGFQVKVQVRVLSDQVRVRVQVQQKWTRVRTRVQVRTRVLQVWFIILIG